MGKTQNELHQINLYVHELKRRRNGKHFPESGHYCQEKFRFTRSRKKFEEFQEVLNIFHHGIIIFKQREIENPKAHIKYLKSFCYQVKKIILTTNLSRFLLKLSQQKICEERFVLKIDLLHKRRKRSYRKEKPCLVFRKKKFYSFKTLPQK